MQLYKRAKLECWDNAVESELLFQARGFRCFLLNTHTISITYHFYLNWMDTSIRYVF